MKYIFFLLTTIYSFCVFSQKPMLCARIEGTWHFYDTNGKEMFEPHIAKATMPEGWVNGQVSVLQVVSATLDSSENIMPIFRRVLLDTKGNVVLAPKIETPYRILNPVDASGYAELRNNETGELLLCNKEGDKITFPNHATTISYKGEGMIEFITKEDSANEETNPVKTLYDLKQNKVIFKGKWEFMGRFFEGVALFSDNQHKIGAITRKGEIIIPNLYKTPVEDDFTFMTEEEHQFYVLVDSVENFHLFDKKGKEIANKSFEQMPVISNGCMAVWDAEKEWYLMDSKGNTIAEKVWKNNQHTEGFNQAGIAAITKDEIYTLINTKGEQLVPFDKEYRFAITAPSTIFLSKDEQKWDIFNAKGKIVRSITVNNIQPFGKYHYASFSSEEQIGLISDEGKIIIPAGNYEFSTICDDFFETKQTNGDNILYQYWNPAGKMVLKNPIQDMGADWIIPVQPEMKFYIPL